MNTQAPITHVIAFSGERGELGHGSYPCKMEGCNGRRLSVKWQDGSRTFPCTKGMRYANGVWSIL